MVNMTEQVFKQDKMYSIADRIKSGEAKQQYVYCMENDKFYVYQNNYWKILFELEVMGNICEQMPQVNKFTLATKNQILGHMRVLLRKRIDCFNSTNLLNFGDGEFDPITQELHEHKKEHYSTIRIPYPYDYSSSCELWLKSLEEIFEGDIRKVNLLQEFFGYCLVPDVRQKKALLIMGESNSGKSTILFLLRAMLGDANCSSVPLKHLGHPQYAPMMINKLVNIDTDVSKNAEDYEEDFKKITSGEPITCNQKFIETFDFVPKCRIVLAANKFPRITDHSSAFYNRLILIPCDHVFEEKDQNKNLVEDLKEELPGIFNWAVRGLKRLRERGMFEKFDFMEEALQELRDESNPVDVFFRENLAIDVNGGKEVEKLELYARYCEWCRNNGNAPMANNKFGSTTYQKYCKYTPKDTKSSKGNGKRVWKNLELINHAVSQGELVTWQDQQ